MNNNVKKELFADKGWLAVRIFLAVLGLFFLLNIAFGDRSNCGIDEATLACKWKGSLADIIGTIGMIGFIVFISGLADLVGMWLAGKTVYSYGGKSAGMDNAAIGFVLGLVSIALIMW